MKAFKHLLTLFTKGTYPVFCISLLNLPYQTDVAPWNSGVGSRALSLGGNYVSQSGDLSGLFYNPAGLSQKRTNEINISGDWLRLKIPERLLSTDVPANGESIRLNSIGMIGISKDYEGLVTGIGFQNPFSFDDFQRLHKRILQDGDLIDLSEQLVSEGGLDFWSLGIAVPVSREFLIGGTISIVSGFQSLYRLVHLRKEGQSTYSNPEDYTAQTRRSYRGYDARFGLLYKPSERFQAGCRLVVPGIIKFTENTFQKYTHIDSAWSFKQKGKLRTSLSGAAGASIDLLSMTFSGEFRFRAPYDYFDVLTDSTGNGAATWKKGIGVGIEFSPEPFPVALRSGYSIDEVDRYAFLLIYDDKSTLNDQFPSGKQTTLSGGIGITFSERAVMNCTYLYYIQRLKRFDGFSEKNRIRRILLDLSIYY